jgi:hypothetical protein
MMTCLQLAERLERAAIRARNELDIPTKALMIVVAAQAKEAIGTFKYDWPELAASTQADRVSKGYPADEPLLRTGEMANSIQHKSEIVFGGAEGVVYSTDPVAVFQEMGTKNIPPRSFLYGAMRRSQHEMGRIFVAFAVKLLTGL